MSTTDPTSALRKLPRVDHVLETPEVAALPWERAFVRSALVEILDEVRGRLRSGRVDDKAIESASLPAVVRALVERLRARTRVVPRPVINASGTLLHTNIGRAPLSRAAIEAMVAAAGCCDLEIDLESGQRGSRMTRLCRLFSVLVGAEDVLVVNNGAAAILLACTALAAQGPNGRRGIALSRGQMVEIGDGFRVATMMASGGVPLVEVGSTNRTHLRDFEVAVASSEAGGAAVAALAWVHASNFSQTGFVKEVGLAELAKLARSHGVPLIADLGSGSLGKGLPEHEPTVPAYLQQGADLVTFSGDKLLGGPQAGVLAGSAEYIARCRRHPMARALRARQKPVSRPCTQPCWPMPSRVRPSFPCIACWRRASRS